MTPFKYKINLQWSESRKAYEAFAPTLLADTTRFLPGFFLIVYDEDPSVAVGMAMKKAGEAVAHLKKMGILPPESDTRVVRFEQERFANG